MKVKFLQVNYEFTNFHQLYRAYIYNDVIGQVCFCGPDCEVRYCHNGVSLLLSQDTLLNNEILDKDKVSEKLKIAAELLAKEYLNHISKHGYEIIYEIP